MTFLPSRARVVLALSFAVVSSLPAPGQELSLSGATGFDLVYATEPGGTSRMYAINAHRSATPFALGPAVAAVPSRWAHRRRTLGALETAIANDGRSVFFTPMGDGVGTGAIHLVDVRGPLQSALVATGNPACYDLTVVRMDRFVLSAEDDGAGGTLLRGFSYQTPGALTPLVPATLTLPGSPAAYVNRMGLDEAGQVLYVPTSTGVQIVHLSPTAPHLVAGPFLSTAPAAPTTNPARFERGGATTWIVGTSTFHPAPNENQPLAAGYFAWTAAGAVGAGTFGAVPSAPGKEWVPGAGTEELALVSDGTDAYAYYLLREPPPGTFFIKPSAVGVVRFVGASAPVVSTILMPLQNVGEPFGIPTVWGARVAFESSFGPPFNAVGGGEALLVIYSPLDPLGSSSVDGVLGAPAPLGGRVSTKGFDRPLWSLDGTRLLAATSHFPGAPNPGVPGLEVLDVPADVPLNPFVGPHTVIPNLPFPNQSIVFPSVFRPRNPAAVPSLAGFTFCGNVFNQGLASLAAPSWGEVGQLQPDRVGFALSPAVPNFPAIFPATFHDASGPTAPIPPSFGARRTTFNAAPSQGFGGLVMSAALEDEVLVQWTGVNVLATFGVGLPHDTTRVPLPAGSITTTEFLSL